ncbi:MAG: preprotein translocase subunit Sec61beta [Candidatus Nanohaloarchaea archaeon]
MAKDDQVQMPSSQGGLVQYFDADSGMDLDPKVVVGATSAVAIVMLALNMGLLV